jgi:hypothetical protein
MPDGPTAKPADFHDLITWYERRKAGRRRRRRVDQRAAMAELRALADETYQLALHEILQVTATPNFVPGLLNSPQGAPLARWELEGCQLDLIQDFDRQGARLVLWADVALNSRLTGEGRYHDLRFRLARPAELDKYLAGKPLRPLIITDATLVSLVFTDEVLQRHRDEREPPAVNLVQVVAQLRYPDVATPRDNVGRVLREDEQVVSMYGIPKQGPPKTWARALYNSLKEDLAAFK